MLKTNTNKIIATVFIWATAFNPLLAFAAPGDVTSGSIELSGSVPEIFSMQVRGVPGDLDLTPGVQVNNRLMGIFHLKYNINIATLIMTSSTASGMPENAGTAYPFATAIAYGMTCSSVLATYASAGTASALTAVLVAAGATNIVSTAIPNFGDDITTNGAEEDCPLTASWVGTSTALPVAGVYSETLTLTMTST